MRMQCLLTIKRKLACLLPPKCSHGLASSFPSELRAHKNTRGIWGFGAIYLLCKSYISSKRSIIYIHTFSLRAPRCKVENGSFSAYSAVWDVTATYGLWLLARAIPWRCPFIPLRQTNSLWSTSSPGSFRSNLNNQSFVQILKTPRSVFVKRRVFAPYRLPTTVWGLRVHFENKYKVALFSICPEPPFNPFEQSTSSLQCEPASRKRVVKYFPNLLRNFSGFFGYKEPQFPYYCNKQLMFAKQEILNTAEGYGSIKMPTNPNCAHRGKKKL